MRGATAAALLTSGPDHEFLSTLPVRGATRCKPAEWAKQAISIHAPREGSDLTGHLFSLFHVISIHAPREGSDAATEGQSRTAEPFLSTLPVRGATAGAGRWHCSAIFLSTLPVRGATTVFVTGQGKVAISIHAPREGSDRVVPVGRGKRSRISIHAPREGSDKMWTNWPTGSSNFYPRSP